MLRIAAAAAALFALASAAIAQTADPLAQLNDTARAVYADGRARMLAATDPVILVGGELVLRHQGSERRADYTPEIYTRLKQVAHLPLGIFGALAPAATGNAGSGDDWRADLDALEAAAAAARAAVPRLPLEPASRDRQTRLIESSLTFIRLQRTVEQPDWHALSAYARLMAPLVLANTTEAANAQLDAIHTIVTGWRSELGEEAWQRAYVLVLGPKAPRAGNLAFRYFTAALGPGSAGTKVIYAESIFDETAALGLLGTLLIDRRVGAAFFGEPARMERDMLADAATAWVLQKFGRLGAE